MKKFLNKGDAVFIKEISHTPVREMRYLETKAILNNNENIEHFRQFSATIFSFGDCFIRFYEKENLKFAYKPMMYRKSDDCIIAFDGAFAYIIKKLETK